MIKYSLRAIKGLAYLFRPYNDIDIYVEDTQSRNMYEVLVNRILDQKAKVERIFQLGGKQEVLDECGNDQDDSSRRRLYIIDGDFEFLNEMEMPDLRYLYRLNVYSSENLTLSERAVIEVAYETLTNVAKDKVAKIVDYEVFIRGLVEGLLPLIVLYAVVHKLAVERNIHIHIQTTAYSLFALCEDHGHGPCVSRDRVNARIEQIVNELVQGYGCDYDQLKGLIGETEGRLCQLGNNPVNYIPGKNHVLPLLYHYLKGRVHFAGNIEQLKVRLARYVELDIDPDLESAIVSTSQQ